MTDMLSLSRKAFKRGVDEVLTFKPLRRVAAGYWKASEGVTADTSATETRVVTVVKSGQHSWHVKRSS